eukprot:757563-Hanusia_phi.AAC.4
MRRRQEEEKDYHQSSLPGRRRISILSLSLQRKLPPADTAVIASSSERTCSPAGRQQSNPERGALSVLDRLL